jgi:hypothetical protein
MCHQQLIDFRVEHDRLPCFLPCFLPFYTPYSLLLMLRADRSMCIVRARAFRLFFDELSAAVILSKVPLFLSLSLPFTVAPA